MIKKILAVSALLYYATGCVSMARMKRENAENFQAGRMQMAAQVTTLTESLDTLEEVEWQIQGFQYFEDKGERRWEK